MRETQQAVSTRQARTRPKDMQYRGVERSHPCMQSIASSIATSRQSTPSWRACISTTATMHADIADVHINSDARPQVTMHRIADAHSNIVWAAHLELVRPRRTRRRHRRHKPELVGNAKVRRCAVCAASQASEGCDEDRASCRHRCHPRRPHRQTD